METEATLVETQECEFPGGCRQEDSVAVGTVAIPNKSGRTEYNLCRYHFDLFQENLGE